MQTYNIALSYKLKLTEPILEEKTAHIKFR